MHSQLIRFLFIVSLVVLYTSYKAVQLWPSQRHMALFFTLALFLVMIGWEFIYRSNPSVVQTSWFQVLAWTGSLAMSLWATYILVSLPVDFFQVSKSIFNRFSDAATPDPVRRGFLFQGLSLSLLGVSGGLAGLGLLEVLRGPRTQQVPVSIRDLPPSLQNLRIAQISDLHVGPTIRKEYVEEVVRRTNAAQPDIIFITGDLADAKAAIISDYLAPLGQLKARYGIYYVTGNHEYYWDAEGLVSKARELGFIPLLNENRVVEIGGTKLLIAGVTDSTGGQFLAGHEPDARKAIQSPMSTHLKILLAHRPDACLEAEKLGFDLQFSGHTHAGQFFPFSLLIGLAHKYYRGLNRHGRMWVYVNSGTGYWGPPNRLGIGSEITLAVLQNAGAPNQS